LAADPPVLLGQFQHWAKLRTVHSTRDKSVFHLNKHGTKLSFRPLPSKSKQLATY